jgi:hypothetical protein
MRWYSNIHRLQDSLRYSKQGNRYILYSILIEYGKPIKLDRFDKMCLNEIFSIVHMGNYSPNTFPFQKYLQQEDNSSPLFFELALKYTT